jgi:hypothetical protein
MNAFDLPFLYHIHDLNPIQIGTNSHKDGLYLTYVINV